MSHESGTRDFGLLMLRVGIGIMFVFHGWPKISGGPEVWERLGQAAGVFGLTFAPVFWGFMAAFAEFAGGILLALGLFFRISCGLLLVVMIVAAGMHISNGDGFNGFSHALELAILFASLLFIGPGDWTLAGRNRVLKRL